MAKAVKKEEAVVEAVVSEPFKATGKFEVVAEDGGYVVYSPEGVRVSTPDVEAKAVDLAFRFNQFRR